ncbi:MAG TPA: DUF6600 domain-containing protein [Thermoanaerobaculia bacterium]|nr:DUF6600 domain-containing protein [Thermoanaerobaculia bacterium]
MKPTRILFLSLILLGAAAGTGFAATSVAAGIHIGPGGHASVDVGFFYDDLASYGNWVERPNYGWAWRPRAVASSWRPYQAGHWVWTDDGWTWISNEPYGWATYHYGRWYDDPDYGWEWIPGNEWAPAWVAWQESNDYLGWAPLPPSVDFRPGIELNVSLGADAYVFVPERQFLATRLNAYFVPRADCERIYRSGRNITRYNVVGNRVFNQGVQVDRLQQVVGRPVPRYQIADLNADQRHQGARVAQNRVALFRPQVDKAQVAPPPSRPIARRAVLAGAAAATIVAAHHANRAQATGNLPPAPPANARQQAKDERRQIAQAPPAPKQHGRSTNGVQPAPQAQQPPAVQKEARQQKNQQRQAQQQAAQQQGEEQKAQRQVAQQQRNQQRQAAQQQAEEQKAQRQAAQQQRAEQRQAQRQEAQQPRQQRQPERQAPPPQQDRAQRQQPPPQAKNQGKPPGKPHDEKQKPPPPPQ